jgi:hypothetical protein
MDISDYLLLEINLLNPLIIYFRDQIHCSSYTRTRENEIIQRIDEILETFQITECKYHLQCVCVLSILIPIYNIIKNSLFSNISNCNCNYNCNIDDDYECICECHYKMEPRNGRYASDLIWYGLHKYLLINGFTKKSANKYLIFRHNETQLNTYTSIEKEFKYTMCKYYENKYQSKYLLYNLYF